MNAWGSLCGYSCDHEVLDARSKMDMHSVDLECRSANWGRWIYSNVASLFVIQLGRHREEDTGFCVSDREIQSVKCGAKWATDSVSITNVWEFVLPISFVAK
jgi:hypothetical protein